MRHSKYYYIDLTDERVSRRKREKYENFLETVEILKTMDPYERSKLSDAIREERYKKDDFIIREGEAGDKFYLISEGEAIATKLIEGNTTQVMSYKRGQYFGERALLTNDTRAANIIATSNEVVCLSLERETFSRLLGPLDAILQRNMEAYAKFK